MRIYACSVPVATGVRAWDQNGVERGRAGQIELQLPTFGRASPSFVAACGRSLGRAIHVDASRSRSRPYLPKWAFVIEPKEREHLAHWLLKTEAETWSWAQQLKRGERGEAWTGVRNHTAKQNLAQMKRGELAFFYHSGKDREIVGLVKVIREAYPDPTDPLGKFVAVDVVAVTPAPHPLKLSAVREEPRLAEMVLVNNSRLSVQPVSEDEWQCVLELTGLSGAIKKPSRATSRG